MNRKKEAALSLRAIKLLIAVGLFVACVKNTEDIPAGYLSHEQMIPIVVDIHLVEGARSGTLILGDTNKLPDYYARIYQKYGLTDSAFKTNFDWYIKHPEHMKAVFDAAIVSLSKMEEKVKNPTQNQPEGQIKSRKKE